MNEPPLMIDGTRVVEYAEFDRSAAPSNRISVSVGGVPVDLNSVAGVIVAENLAESGFFVLHCNERWETLAAAHYPDRAAARDSAERAYSGLASQWRQFHELSREEAAEVQATRTFLRQLAAEFPNR